MAAKDKSTAATIPTETPSKNSPKVPTLEEAIASLGAPEVEQGGHDGRAKFALWLEDFLKKNPDVFKSQAEKDKEKEVKEAAAAAGHK